MKKKKTKQKKKQQQNKTFKYILYLDLIDFILKYCT